MDIWRCVICDYVYDKNVGDKESGINSGTKFEDVNEEWLCPVCFVGKEHFEKISH